MYLHLEHLTYKKVSNLRYLPKSIQFPIRSWEITVGTTLSTVNSIGCFQIHSLVEEEVDVDIHLIICIIFN